MSLSIKPRNEIHVSGPSGSGKSWLSLRLIEQNTIYVVDMDDFFQPGDGRWEELEASRIKDPTSVEFNELWYRMKDERFAYHREEAARTKPGGLIVWVGLTDHAAPPDVPFYKITEAFRHFYIDIEDSTLCRQYYSRLVSEQQQQQQDWLQVPSSETIVKEAKHMKEVHLHNGYLLWSIGFIESYIVNMAKVW